jgi:hypothetical protein
MSTNPFHDSSEFAQKPDPATVNAAPDSPAAKPIPQRPSSASTFDGAFDQNAAQPHPPLFTFDEAFRYFSYRLPNERLTKRDSMNVRCPFHGDKQASMSLNLAKAVWNCHGCNLSGGILDFERQMFGKDAEESWAQIYKIIGREAKHNRKLVATYDYVDVDGALLYQKLRYEPKQFSQRQPDGKGGWFYNLNGVKKVLYHLPEVITSKYVAIVEGEKDADRLRAALLAADVKDFAVTTTFDGAGHWKPEYAYFFTGRMAIVMRDEDAKGCIHQQTICASIKPYAGKVKALVLPGLSDQQKDISDWLNGGHLIKEFLNLIQSTPLWKPEATEQSTRPASIEVPASGTSQQTAEVGPVWPTLSAAALHGLVGDVVKTIEPHSEADPAAILIQTLVALGNMIGHGPHCNAEADRHALNLYAALVGETSKGRKGTSWGHVKRLCARVDEPWASSRVTGGLSSAEGLISEVRDDVVPPLDRRLLLVQPEFASVLKAMQREGNNLSPLMRTAWDGDQLRTLVKNNPLKATGEHISMIAHSTRMELLRYLSDTEAHNGFANRLLWCCIKRSKCLPEGGNVPEDGITDLVRRLQDVVKWAGEAGEICLERDEAARGLWAAVYRKLSDGQPGLLGAATGRGEAHVLRLSAIYAVLDCSKTVRAEHLQAALAVWDYCYASAKYIFGDAIGDPVADRVREALRDAAAGLTRTQMRDLLGRHASADRIGQALTQLAALGIATCQMVSTEGRPIELWTATEATKATEGQG